MKPSNKTESSFFFNFCKQEFKEDTKDERHLSEYLTKPARQLSEYVLYLKVRVDMSEQLLVTFLVCVDWFVFHYLFVSFKELLKFTVRANLKHSDFEVRIVAVERNTAKPVLSRPPLSSHPHSHY